MKFKKIVIHHTASPRDTTTLEMVTKWHTDKGWNGIGYHRFIDGKGKLYQGRPDSQIGAHAYGHNRDTMGICVAGNFDRESLGAAQRKTLVQTLAVLCARHGLTEKDIIGHRDLMATSCPGGDLYDELPSIRKDVAGYLKK